MKKGGEMRALVLPLVLASIGAGWVFAGDAVVSTSAMHQLLTERGWREFSDQAQRDHWPTPWIPSRWHVERFATGEVRQAQLAARDLGKELTDQLTGLGAKLNAPMPTEELHRYTKQLLNLSEWCANAEGYGNLLLAQRSLDLACIPLTRHVADITVDPVAFKPFLSRLAPKWMSAEVRRRMLNTEVGTEMFRETNNPLEELGIVHISGTFLLSQKRHPGWDENYRGDPELKEIMRRVERRPEILANLEFFQDDKPPSVTLQARWDAKYHERFVTGLELRSVKEVLALAEFRAIVGFYPTDNNPHALVRSSEEAFKEAWQPKVERISGMTFEQWSERLTLYVTAWHAYESAKRGGVLDFELRRDQNRKK